MSPKFDWRSVTRHSTNRVDTSLPSFCFSSSMMSSEGCFSNQPLRLWHQLQASEQVQMSQQIQIYLFHFHSQLFTNLLLPHLGVLCCCLCQIWSSSYHFDLRFYSLHCQSIWDLTVAYYAYSWLGSQDSTLPYLLAARSSNSSFDPYLIQMVGFYSL